tara:strand:- start:1168 stop:1401 length:234 start_codon:yes stop_codon:yes gene_type:complete
MSEEKKVSKSCSGKQKAMFTYGVLQLASTIISAVALSAIALSLCSVKQESKLFNECADEILSTGSSKSEAVRFCNGG